MSKYLLRSLLFSPAHNERYLLNALRSEADVIIPDLEDSVHSTQDKILARKRIAEFASRGYFKNKPVFPRVNGLESGLVLQDIYELTIPGIEGFMLPKASKAEDIHFIDRLLAVIENEKKIDSGTFKLIPIIETSAAVLHAEQICKASKRVIAVVFGCGDYLSDMKATLDAEYQSIFTPRALIAMAARASNIIPIDTPHLNIYDLKDLEFNLKIAKKLGYSGSCLMHPMELPLIHQYFSPSEDELIEAEEICRIYDSMIEEGKSIAMYRNRFIGPPIVEAAKNLLSYHKLILDKNHN